MTVRVARYCASERNPIDEYEFLPISQKPKRLGFWEVDNPEVGKALDRFNPDVTQVFGYAHRTNWRAARWANLRRRPLMLYSDSNSSAKSKWWKRLIKKFVVQRFYNRVDAALFVSQKNQDYHAAYGLPAERLFPGVLPIDRYNLVNLVTDRKAARESIRSSLGIPTDAFVVMFCGKYICHKNPADLLTAAWRAAKKGVPVWSLFVGEGPERASLEDRCRKYAITNSTLTGFVNQASIAQYYAASDALALPSSREPFGLVVSEGASFGLPVIVSDRVGCAGPNDVARSGVNAFVYPCGDVDAIERAIESLCVDKELYAKMSNESLKISEGQDVTVAATALATASFALQELGTR